MKKTNLRIDVLLVEKGLAESREQAKKMVMAGCVYADNIKVEKPSSVFGLEAEIEVKNFEKEFVSRGGYKLKKALIEFGISLKAKVAADIGASTGGFSDCMLQKGAKRVFAVDTGYGQLDWKIRSDERVKVFERFNARFLEADTFDMKVDFIAVDVSFISLKLIFPAIVKTMKKKATAVCLIKPQFEAGREKVGKKGVVREKSTHAEVIQNVIGYALDNGLSSSGLSYSPIKGPNGNIEYLLYLIYGGEKKKLDVESCVEAAWNDL